MCVCVSSAQIYVALTFLLPPHTQQHSLDRAGLRIPSERVAARGLTVTRAAVFGADAAVPTVGSTLRGAARALLRRGRAGSVRALDGVSCLLKPGTLTLVIGPPGSGKTALLKALTGRIKPDRYTKIEVRRAGGGGAVAAGGGALSNGRSPLRRTNNLLPPSCRPPP